MIATWRRYTWNPPYPLDKPAAGLLLNKATMETPIQIETAQNGRMYFVDRSGLILSAFHGGLTVIE